MTDARDTQATIVATWCPKDARSLMDAKERTQRDLGAQAPRAIIVGVKHYVFRAEQAGFVASWLGIDLGDVAEKCRRRPNGLLVIAAAR